VALLAEEAEVFGIKSDPVPLCPPQILPDLIRAGTLAASELTVLAMARACGERKFIRNSGSLVPDYTTQQA
jgi:hypothetical protein